MEYYYEVDIFLSETENMVVAFGISILSCLQAEIYAFLV